MDIDRIGRGEMIAGLSGLALLIVAVFFDWFSLEGFGGTGFEFAGWLRDLVLFLTIVGGIGLAVLVAMSPSVNLPVAPSALVAGIAILNTLLILIWVIDPPDAGAFGIEISVDRSFGLWLGLLASAGVAYGAWEAMQEEGPGPRDRSGARSDHPAAGEPRDSAPPPPPPPPTG